MYEPVNRAVEWCQYIVFIVGNHFGWTDSLRGLWRYLEQWLNG